MTGALVLLVHHSGKDASRGARGWSGTRAAADVEIEVSKNDCDHAATITKMKDGEDGRAFGFKLLPILLGHDEDGDEITSCIVSPSDFVPRAAPPKRGANQRAVLGALHDLMPIAGDGVAIEQVLARAIDALPFDPEKGGRDRRREYVQRALREIINQGEVVEASGLLRPADLQNDEESDDDR
jgi:hypothetical protein